MAGKPRTNLVSTDYPRQAEVILQSISDGFYALDRNWRYTYANRLAAELMQLPLEEIIGRNIWETFPRFLGTPLESNFRLTMSDRRPREFDMHSADGRFWHHFRVYPSRDGIAVYYLDISERKKAEEALKESEEKYRNLAEQATDGLFIVDSRGIITAWNAAEEKITGIDRRQVLGKPIWETNYSILPEEQKAQISMEQMKADTLELIRTRQSPLLNKPGINTIIRADGTRRVINISLFIINLKTDFLICNITRDITEYIEAEEALKNSEEKYRSFTEQSIDGLAIINRQGLVMEWNRALEQITGIPRSQALGRPMWEVDYQIIPPEHKTQNTQDQMKSRLLSLFKNLDSLTNHDPDPLDIVRLDGQRRTVVLSLFAIKMKDEYWIGNITRDVTERAQAQLELARAKENLEIRVKEQTAEIASERQRLFKVLETLPDMICLMTPDYRVVFANRAFREKFGEPGGRRCYEISFGFNRPCNFCESFRVLGTSQPHHWEVTAPADGSVFDTWDYPFTDTDGSQLVLEMKLDVTEHKQTEVDLIKARDELSQVYEQLKDYSHKITRIQEEERKRIAYELHDDTAQYLSILKMQINALVHSGRIQDPVVLEKLGFLEKDADRAFHDVRRYSHELRPVVLEHMGLLAALDQIADDYNKLGQVSVEVNSEGQEPELPEEIKLGFFRIAQEALNNTRKHAKATESTINLRFSKDRLELEVSDNGVGFDVKKARQLTGGKGSLGLMSMHERAELINADLKIESEIGRGTAVTVSVDL